MTLAEAYRVLTTTEYSENVSRAEFEKLRQANLRLFFAFANESPRPRVLHYNYDGENVCPKCGGGISAAEIYGIRRAYCVSCGDFPVIT